MRRTAPHSLATRLACPCVTTFALGDVVLAGLSAAGALACRQAVEARARGRGDPVPPTRASAVSGALVLALWEVAGRGPKITVLAISGVLVVALLALLAVETVTIALRPNDDRDLRGWIVALVLTITVGAALALVA